MYNDISNNTNSILIDKTTNSKSNKNRKIYCVLCFPKIELTLTNPEEFRYVCKRCKNDYQILEHNSTDIIPEEDELISSHESDDEGPVLISAEEEFKSYNNNDNESKSDIKIPRYMTDSETTKVIDYNEY